MKHYIIERLSWDTSGPQKETWKQCNKREVEETMFIVEELKDGGEYEFRVKAVNEAGASRPSATAGPIVIKDQTCMLTVTYKHNMHATPYYASVILPCVGFLALKLFIIVCYFRWSNH